MPQITDWLVASYTSNSAPYNASRCVNMFAEIGVQDAKSKSPVAVWMHPGTSPFANVGKGPVLAFTFMGGEVYAITGNALYKLVHDGTVIYLGTTSVSANGCSVDNNGTTICWCDGFTGWTYNATNGVRQITDPQWFPSYSVVYFDTYFVFGRKGSQQFSISPPQWDGTNVDPSATPNWQFASKEATSDLVVALANVHQQLFVFGEKRGEVWYDAGNEAPNFPFQRSAGALIQRGLMAPYTVVLEDNTVFMFGDDAVFYRLNGFVPERVSDHAIESRWQKYRGLELTRAFSYTIFGHKMIALTFPQAKATWVLDLATKRWHERESWLGDNEDTTIGRWRVNCAINNSSSTSDYPELLFGDSSTGRIDRVNNEVFTEFGNTMRALIIGPPIHSDRRRMFMRRFEIDVESGVGLPYTQQVLNEFCPGAITMTTPAQIATPGALLGIGSSFSSFVFSDWVHLPDDGAVRGLVFGSHKLSISIINDASTTGNQIVVKAFDAGGAPIVDAEYHWTAWSNWVWVGITCDTATHQIQCWVSTAGYGDTQLTPVSLTWSSTAAIPNDAGDSWSLIPTGG